MAYTVHQAKTNFSRILKEVEAGQEVIVLRGKKPVAKIVAIDHVSTRKALAGAYAGRVSWTEDAFDPLTDRELTAMGWDYMTEAPLIAPAPPEK